MKDTVKTPRSVADSVTSAPNSNLPTPNNALQILLAASMSMSIRLAIVVLLPILGGHELDSHFKTMPTFTLIGFALAFVATFLLLRNILMSTYQQKTKEKSDKK